MNTTDINCHNKQIVFTCTSNERYVPPLVSFLNSIYKNSPGVCVVVRLVNCNISTIRKLNQRYTETIFVVDEIDISDTRTICNDTELVGKSIADLRSKQTRGFSGVRWLYSKEAAYCSNIKYNTICKLLDQNNKCIVHMDVDTIVRDDINDMDYLVRDHDLGMYICPEEHMKQITEYGDNYMGWHAGIVIANNNVQSKKFLKEVESRVANNIYDIEADEDEFDYVYHKSSINVKSVPKIYKDNGPIFDNNSKIWSGQSEAKSDNKQYVLEYEKYKEKL